MQFSYDNQLPLFFQFILKTSPGARCLLLGANGSGLLDVEENELIRLVYVSCEKRPSFEHHKKAGAMNALIRDSVVLSNAPYILNVNCDNYINNIKAPREATCFMMDPTSGRDYAMFSVR